MRQADSNGITVEKFHSLLSLARYYIMTRHLERPSRWCFSPGTLVFSHTDQDVELLHLRIKFLFFLG